MRDVLKTEELEIPSGIDVTVKSRLISVTGPRGTLTKNVRHVDMDIRVVKGKTTVVTLAVWQGGRKHVACLRTIRTLINNMVIGVTKVCILCSRLTPILMVFQGFRYKMRSVYAHFPINCIIQENGAVVEIRNFLGEKVCMSCCLSILVHHHNFSQDGAARKHVVWRIGIRISGPKRRAYLGGK